MSRHPFVLFLREVLAEWQRDRALVLGAALAYYTLFALAPLLVLVIAVAGLALGRAAAQGEIVAQIEGLMGPDGAKMIEGMIVRASRPASGVVATLVSLGTMLLGASGVFGQLQAALDQIFGAEASGRRGGGVRAAVRQRLAYVGMILGIGFLLLVSLVLSAALAAVHDLLAARLPVAARVLPPLNFGLSFVVVSGLFALVYKVLPAVELAWRDVWLGAACTAILFTAGKSLIGIYLGRAGATSVYGAAGSLVLVLLWIYYSAQILLLGAEFTEVYSRRWGSRRTAGA
ncbi:MAG: YihY/virulence factor BrkB family protein [Deltaproteobacteria bacterium]|nr:MAG: YihY/virulence factor BrkB family protein [Deltaproteobacteria bacterium]